MVSRRREVDRHRIILPTTTSLSAEGVSVAFLDGADASMVTSIGIVLAEVDLHPVAGLVGVVDWLRTVLHLPRENACITT